MSTPKIRNPSMDHLGREGQASFVVGIAIAFLAALLIRATPPAVFEPRGTALGIAYLLVAIGALGSVALLARLSGLAGNRLARIVNAGLLGALAFDGLMIGFRPSLYGQESTSLAMAAAGLLWGVFCFGAAGAWMAARTDVDAQD